MITKTSTIQELTLEAHELRLWSYLYDEKNMTRDEIFNIIEGWAAIFEKVHEGYNWNGDYYDEIDRFIAFCEQETRAGREVTAESYLQPRITIGFCVTEFGTPVSGVLEFPKRGEDMVHGSEHEWYYSLRENTDEILKLKVGESIPFKIRDDKDSVGSVTRLK
jgi:hypothetical protein